MNGDGDATEDEEEKYNYYECKYFVVQIWIGIVKFLSCSG